MKILDACCGSRMFWFDKNYSETVFMDNRNESHMLKDKGVRGGLRSLSINPAILADFRALPFKEKSFSLVVFDPPHLKKGGQNSWIIKKYGKLGKWQNDLKIGFSECFRVLQTSGTLIFKWNEYDIPVSQILSLTDQTPLFGHRSGKQAKTHWIVFMKPPT